jgi:hypothetical protein
LVSSPKWDVLGTQVLWAISKDSAARMARSDAMTMSPVVGKKTSSGSL